MSEIQFDFFQSDTEKQEIFSGKVLPKNIMQEKLAEEKIILKENEIQILKMVLSGKSISEMSVIIFRSRACIKWRLTCLYTKFNVESRLDLIEKSSTEGLQFFNEKNEMQSYCTKIEVK